MSHDQVNTHRRRTVSAFGPFLAGVVEIVAFVIVGNAIGFGYAILLALATSVLGLWLMRRAGFRAWRSLRAAAFEAAQSTDEPQVEDQTGITGQRRSPEEGIADAGVTLLAGTMLMLPGFVTDSAALALLLPPVRRSVGRRLAAAALRTFPARGTPGRRGGQRRGDVIEGEVLGDSAGQPRRPDAQQEDEG
ncbi:FxsA family protein [Phytoactinopolyspora halotolerans]|uniref:FxsA family protein n=1 Tax=Phytoactinopolyspora halotolerans TaxID=1981512 RepID=A0A6L9SBK4_9ACTN|nr:FxsA family protein [Phytoactinopolyspora halotolerans]NEE01390.1 FxsA family protein [Phytoactinopolyspora halotolerans]